MLRYSQLYLGHLDVDGFQLHRRPRLFVDWPPYKKVILKKKLWMKLTKTCVNERPMKRLSMRRAAKGCWFDGVVFDCSIYSVIG